MPVTLKEILKLPSTSKIKLIAGRTGLDQVVTRTLIGHIDYASDTTGGELLFITGAGFKADEGTLKALVSESVYKNLSGIVFAVPGELIRSVDKNVMAFADHLSFPLFLAPCDLRLSSLAKGIDGYIKQRGDEEEILNILLERVLYAGPDEIDGIKKRILQLGCRFADRYQTTAIQILQPRCITPSQALHREYVQLYIRNLLSRCRGGTLTMTRHSEIVLFVPCESDNSRPPDLTGALDAIITHFPGIHIKTGKWEITGGIRASAAGNLGPIGHGGQENADFGVYELCRLCCDAMEGDEIEAFCDRYIGKLIRYDQLNGSDLIHTIEVYYENRFNLSRTAKELSIHRNSLMYRLRRIEEIIGRKLSAPYVLLDIINSVYIKKALESVKDRAG